MAVTTTDAGRRGEQLALKYLQKQGLRLLERNYRAGHLEIDLIMAEGDTIVFVEVKARSRTDYGTPAEYVTRTKRERLIRAASAYLLEQRLSDAPCRFDVAEVALPDGEITHIRDAFVCD